MVRNAVFSFFGLSLFCLPGTVMGQYIGPWDLGTLLTNSTMIDNAINKSIADPFVPRPDRRYDTRNALQALPPPPTTITARDFSYRYSEARTKKNLRSFAERTPEKAGRAELQQMLDAQPTVISDIRASIAPYGLDTHDVADADTLWLINA